MPWARASRICGADGSFEKPWEGERASKELLPASPWRRCAFLGLPPAVLVAAVVVDLVACALASLVGSFGGMRWGTAVEARMLEGEGSVRRCVD